MSYFTPRDIEKICDIGKYLCDIGIFCCALAALYLIVYGECYGV